jgi:hypothetical protein
MRKASVFRVREFSRCANGNTKGGKVILAAAQPQEDIDHNNVGGILNELVNAPSIEPYKQMTGEDFVRGATDNLQKDKLSDS